MNALATQNLLKNNGTDFFVNSDWPGFSADFNLYEHLGAILKQSRKLNINGGGSLQVKR